MNSKNGRWGELPGEWPSQRWAWLPHRAQAFASPYSPKPCSHCPLGYSSPINPGTFYPLLCPRLVCSGVRVKTDAHSRAEQCDVSWNTQPLEWVFKGHRERCPVYANWLFWSGGRLAYSKVSTWEQRLSDLHEWAGHALKCCALYEECVHSVLF